MKERSRLTFEEGRRKHNWRARHPRKVLHYLAKYIELFVFVRIIASPNVPPLGC